MYMINLLIIYNVVNIFSMKNHKSSRKLRVGVKAVNWYPGVNWSTTTILIMGGDNWYLAIIGAKVVGLTFAVSVLSRINGGKNSSKYLGSTTDTRKPITLSLTVQHCLKYCIILYYHPGTTTNFLL